MGVNYYPFHIGDYAKDTRHLSIIEDGAYRRLLDLYYTTEKPLPLPVDNLCMLVGAKTAAEKKAVGKVLGLFFVFGGPQEMVHKRCEREISRAKEKSGKAAASAGMRWQSRRIANALPEQSEGNASQEPIANKHQWWRSDQGIEAKGNELGLKPRPGESWQDYKRRIFDHLNAQKAA